MPDAPHARLELDGALASRPGLVTSVDRELFTRAESEWYAHLKTLFTVMYDIAGACADNQVGLAVEASRVALHAAIDARLVRVLGPTPASTGSSPSDPRRSVQRWQRVVQAWGAQSPLTVELWWLESAAPQSDGECLKYADRCKACIENDLGFPIECSRQEVLRLLQARFDSARLLAALGVPGRDELRVFGMGGYRYASEVDPYDYVAEHLNADCLRAAEPGPGERSPARPMADQQDQS